MNNLINWFVEGIDGCSSSWSARPLFCWRYRRSSGLPRFGGGAHAETDGGCELHVLDKGTAATALMFSARCL
jgi:hypothetical protein